MSSCISSPISHLRRARQYEEGLARNARLRIEGTRNLADAAKAAGVRRMITQSIAFVYAPGDGARDEIDPLDLSAAGARKRTVDGVVALEQATLGAAGRHRAALRLALRPRHLERECQAARKPALHVDAAAQAALLAVTRGAPGIYNIAEDDGAVSSEQGQARSRL